MLKYQSSKNEKYRSLTDMNKLRLIIVEEEQNSIEVKQPII